jgi:hypothetical protein
MRIRYYLVLLPLLLCASVHPQRWDAVKWNLAMMYHPSTLCVGEKTNIEFSIIDNRGLFTNQPFRLTAYSPLGHITENGQRVDQLLRVTGDTYPIEFVADKEGKGVIDLELSPMVPNIVGDRIFLDLSVKPCGWKWSLLYMQDYPNPDGFWTYTEDAYVVDGTLSLEGEGESLTGEGNANFSVDMNGSNPQMACKADRQPKGTGKVRVSGSLNAPAPGSMLLTFDFDPIELPGGAKFQCSVMGNTVNVPFPLPSTSAALNSLGLKDIAFLSDSGAQTIPVNTAVIWGIKGDGHVTITLERIGK